MKNIDDPRMQIDSQTIKKSLYLTMYKLKTFVH